ncbi:hypothetical protein BAJUN_00540 [Bajunvirus bajun]|uniref:Uncharacterized protein n=1 Tax=Brevundimonas phage vB_BgoS-Bajun TaxID=2948594 RepID=A0A9E7N7A3_9CAUD|nr:hypothetical protein BAJUN_00540 [Brevundimonas phage vB_BgoS-Bajun]
MARNKWELLTEEAAEKTDRLKVEGGWVYRTRTVYTGGSSPAMCFVPDTPMHVTTDERADAQPEGEERYNA